METCRMHRIVLAGDLNHHGTLFAGQMSRWLVESCLIQAIKLYGRADNLVCVNIQGLTFKHPIDNGEVVEIETFVRTVGRTSLTIGAHVHTGSRGEGAAAILETAITFVTLDDDGRPMPHGISLEGRG